MSVRIINVGNIELPLNIWLSRNGIRKFYPVLFFTTMIELLKWIYWDSVEPIVPTTQYILVFLKRQWNNSKSLENQNQKVWGAF